MRRIASLVPLIAVFAALFHSGPQQALACSCEYHENNAQRAESMLRVADAVVVARVNSVTSLGRRSGLVSADLVVEQTFKGDVGRRVTVLARLGEAACGLSMNVEQRHILAIYGNDGRHHVDSCTSVPLFSGAEDVPDSVFSELARIATPLTPADGGAPGALITTYIAGSLVALAGLAGITQRRAR